VGSNPTLSAIWRAKPLTTSLKIGLVGLGKIARDQHLPAIAATDGAELVAIASRNAALDGVRNYLTLQDMLAAEPELHAIILCQPPKARFEAAKIALSAGKHVFLEKPPGATVSEVETLTALAKHSNVTLFASWHSRFAAAVAAAKAWVSANTLTSISIHWKEDIRQWHPGQDWILQPGGFGVFDPGINALSILTEIVGEPIRLIDATLQIPSNRQAPIASDLTMRTASGTPILAAFDFRQTSLQLWDIIIEAGPYRLVLSHGGNALSINSTAQTTPPEAEYPSMYQHFVDLIGAGKSDVDLAPLQLVADAFLLGRMMTTDPFEF
jgi:D-galactose 1-dehydrogenase